MYHFGFFLLVLISYSHTHNPALPRSPLSIVTAMVDKIGMSTTGHTLFDIHFFVQNVFLTLTLTSHNCKEKIVSYDFTITLCLFMPNS